MVRASGTSRGIGGQHAVHVGPDDDFVGVEGRAENRGGIIRAAAAERGEHAVFGGADESGDHGNHAVLQHGPQPRFALRSRVRSMIGSAPPWYGSVTINSVASTASLRTPSSSQRAGDHGRGKALAEARNRVERARREFAQQRRAFAEAFAFGENRLHARAQFARGVLSDWISVASAASCCLRSASKIAAARLAIAAFGLVGRFDQPVGHAAHGGNDGDHRAFARGVLHDLRHARDARGVAHGRAAKFHHLHWFAHFRFRFEFPGSFARFGECD